MRLTRALLLLLSVISSTANASAGKQTHNYQSDVARMRKIVIESLYSHREVFLRELISNANDAIEKLRITSLTDKTVYDGSAPLNITIQLMKEEDGKSGRIIISDTGIGMTEEELTKNLGTLAKSGTSEFLKKAEDDKASGTNGNLIGAFGLGFYSSFLVANRVEVASVPPASAKNPHPVQNIFSSGTDDASFEIYPDPRGNTLGRGTEITLHLKEEALEYLEYDSIKDLVHKHSGFSTTFPIYLFEQSTVQEVDEEALKAQQEEEAAEKAAKEAAEAEKEKTPVDDEEATVEDAKEEPKEEEKAPKPTPMKSVNKEEWVHLNNQTPIWVRDPKEITDGEYEEFYKATFKDPANPLAWYHFKGDSGSGTSFRAILFVPSQVPPEFWQSAKATEHDVRLMVKRVFITKELGPDSLPKWASWLKVVVDADDLPLNVSRETLQSNAFLKQLKGIIIKRFIQLMHRLADDEDDEEKFKKVMGVYNPVIKLGANEHQKEKQKLMALARFDTTERKFTSLDKYVENRKTGQKQIFYLAGLGTTPEELGKSIFVEKLKARGYEVLLLTDPMDEILMSNFRKWAGMDFQDVAKKGLKYGDEDEDAEKAEAEQLSETYKPLTEWLKTETKDIVKDVVISNLLVGSPCAIVVDVYGYSANMERLMSAQNLKKDNYMYEMARKQKTLEINPHSPLIQGLLKRVNALGEEKDEEAEAELKEVATILVDGALIRSGFEVADSNLFFTRVDRVLRRSLGVSETAEAKVDIKPAPPVETGMPTVDRVEIPAEGPTNPAEPADDEEFLGKFDTRKGGDLDIEAMIKKYQAEADAKGTTEAATEGTAEGDADKKAEDAPTGHDEL